MAKDRSMKDTTFNHFQTEDMNNSTEDILNSEAQNNDPQHDNGIENPNYQSTESINSTEHISSQKDMNNINEDILNSEAQNNNPQHDNGTENLNYQSTESINSTEYISSQKEMNNSNEDILNSKEQSNNSLYDRGKENINYQSTESLNNTRYKEASDVYGQKNYNSDVIDVTTESHSYNEIDENITKDKNENVLHNSDVISRAIVGFWTYVDNKFETHRILFVRIFKGIINLIVIGYFIWALVYWSQHKVCDDNGGCDMEWCGGIGLLILLVGIAYIGIIYYILKGYLQKPINNLLKRQKGGKLHKIWKSRIRKLVTNGTPMILIIIYLIVDTSENRERLFSMLGLAVFILLGYIFSRHPGQINWIPVLWGIYLQFIFGLFTIRWDVGRAIFKCLGDKVTTFLGYTDDGSEFVYGENLIKNSPVFAFQVLSVIYFFSFMVQLLYYWGAMQWVVLQMGWILHIFMDTTVCESVNAAASVFLGQSEAPLIIKPFFHDLTKSEIHAVMTAGFATVAGTVLAAYVSFGVQASHVITASVMSAPAALCYAKLFYPETEVSKTTLENITLPKGEATGVLDAATQGAISAIQLVLGIIANIIAFIACVSFLDGIIIWLGQLVGSDSINFQVILSKVFIPVSYLMGVETSQVENVAKLVGLKTVVNEFVAYRELGIMKKNHLLTPRSELIATYALCGFANPSSIGIMIGSLSTMAPTQRSSVTEVALRAFIAGSVVCFMTACIAGVLVEDSMLIVDNNNSTI